MTDGIIITTANSFTFDFAPPSGVVNHYVIKYSKRLPPKRFRGELVHIIIQCVIIYLVFLHKKSNFRMLFLAN